MALLWTRNSCTDSLVQPARHIASYYARRSANATLLSREQRPPLYKPGHVVDVTAQIKRRQLVHGLINEYRRAA